jgi:SAM-dependent methyltransferase
MSALGDNLARSPQPEPTTFGAGESEPYARALRRGASGSNVIYLARSGGSTASKPMDVGRWNSDADAADLSLLRAVTGPLLDIGCGPGRMVRAAAELGMAALGVDVSAAAIEVARESGLSVLQASVFDSLPGEGAWQTVLLVDGNIGIGGDVDAMIARCTELVSPNGEIVVELSGDADRDYTYTGRIIDDLGHQSALFPWAEVGITRIRQIASERELEVRQFWGIDGRTFCRLAATRR